MSAIGSSGEMSALQAAQAVQVAAKARDREKAASAQTRPRGDLVELQVAGVVTGDAARALPRNDSEQAETEHEANHPPPSPSPDEAPVRIDVRA